MVSLTDNGAHTLTSHKAMAYSRDEKVILFYSIITYCLGGINACIPSPFLPHEVLALTLLLSLLLVLKSLTAITDSECLDCVAQWFASCRL